MHKLTAISEKGRVTGSGRDLFAEDVLKFDAIARHIQEYHKKTEKTFMQLLTSKDDEFDFNVLSEKELDGLGFFLLAKNTAESPLAAVEALLKSTPAPAPAAPARPVSCSPMPQAAPERPIAAAKAAIEPPAAPAAAPAQSHCGKCSSENVSVAYGKFGYYLKCHDCDGNTALKLTCPNCQQPARIRKEKLDFYQTCPACGYEKLYHQNSKR